MVKLPGYAGKILYIDISKKKHKVVDVKESFARKYLGGIGFATRILYDLLKEKVDAFDARNPIIISPGLLTGFGVPTFSKVVFASKSPLTGGFSRSVAGGRIGPALKYAGYDTVVIQGRCRKPIYIFIDDDRVEFRKAEDLWGLSTRETEERLKEEIGDKTVATAVIGPAGENLSLISCIDCEERQAGRTGLGAIMGAKKIKAIAVRGSKDLIPYDPDKLLEMLPKIYKECVTHPAYEWDVNWGTAEFIDWMNRERGTFPVKNFQEGFFKDAYAKLKEGEKMPLDPYYWVPKYSVRNRACPSCVKPCGKVFKSRDLIVEGPEYETLYSLGGACGVDDIETVAKAHLLCDLYGLDGISAGVTIGWAMECYEKGLLTKEDTDGIELKFGNGEAMLKAIEAIAYRKGKLGKLLADGVRKAARKLGKGSSRFAIHVKGLELPAYDVRGIKGMALAVAVSTRGACHLTACIYGTELVGKWWKFENIDRLSAENKGYEVKVHEDLMALYDALGLCKFSRHIFFAEKLPEIVNAITGFNVDTAYLMTVGERIYNIQRAFNIKQGFTRKDDTLPYRIMHDPIPEGPSKGSYVKPSELRKMLDEYYMARGWSEEGVPTKVKLVTLDLEDIAEEIGAGI